MSTVLKPQDEAPSANNSSQNSRKNSDDRQKTETDIDHQKTETNIDPQKTETDIDPQIGDNKTAKSSSFVRNFFDCLRNFIKQVFSFPLRDEPISFYRNSDFNAKGEYTGTEEDKEQADMLEAFINYDPVSKQRFEMVLLRRKKDLENLDRLNLEPVDLTKFPLWNEETINYLRTTFKTFDVTQDGLLSLENWNDMLYEMGDKSSEEERESQFYRVSDGDSFIDFPQFLDLLYTITMKDHKSPQTVLLATGIRTANYNISRMKNLDLVQRMQVGMF